MTESRDCFERDYELAALAEALARVGRDSGGALVLVHGEAGVGKTALLNRFCQGHEATRLLWGACEALFTPRPLGPFLDIAEELGGALRTLVARDRCRTRSRPVSSASSLQDRLRSSSSRTRTGPTRRPWTCYGCSRGA